MRWLGWVLVLGVWLWSWLPGVAIASEPTTLRVLIGAYEQSVWQPLFREFESSHPGVRVEITLGPTGSSQLSDLYSTSFLVGQSPYDLAYLDVSWTARFARAGWLLPLEDRLSPDFGRDFLAGPWQGGQFDDHQYRIPGPRNDMGGLYIRRDLLAAAGLEPPRSFAELTRIGRDLQQQGQARWSFLWQGKQSEGLICDFVEVLAGFGGQWIDPDSGAIALDQPEAIAAATWLRDTIVAGLSPPGTPNYAEEDTRRLFENGEAVFMRNWPYVWTLANSPTSRIRDRFDLMPMPRQPGGRSGAAQGGWGWAIARSSVHPDAAWELIDFVSQPQIQKQVSLAQGYLPTRRSLFRDPDLQARYPYLERFRPLAEQTVLRPPVPQYEQLSDILQRQLNAAISGDRPVAEAMRQAARESRQLLGQTG